MTTSHPLHDIGLEVSHFKGFGETPTGFQKFEPINVVIGRNNSGKSALIDAVELAVSKGGTFHPLKHSRAGEPFAVYLTQTIDEPSLRSAFSEGTGGGGIPGDHWQYGRTYMGARITRILGPTWEPDIHGDDIFKEVRHSGANYVKNFLTRMTWPFDNVVMLRMSAERDVQPEIDDGSREIHPNGAGVTSLVQAFINKEDLPRREVEVSLLNDLNTVYQGDSTFTQILVRQDGQNKWEIHLREDYKGDIRLSQSGSSLKSIFLLLALMRLVPVIKPFDWAKVILAVEEPENNLHPALLRRLLNFLATKRGELGFTLLLTTHSPVCIDWSARRSDSQVVHVQYRDGYSVARTAIGYTHGRDILDDLDVRASDILQANGVIWVEGPSDRIYLKRWLELISQGKLKEGVHYAVMFYGGKLLSHFDGLPPDESKALVSLLRLNRNVAIVIDSDRRLGRPPVAGKPARKPRLHLNATKTRLQTELNGIGGYVWITEGREIENYVAREVYARASKQPPPTLGPYDEIPEMAFLSDFKANKVALAHAVAEQFTVDDLPHLDLRERLQDLMQRVRQWNGMDD